MDKLTRNSAILRSEVKGQVEFDLLVAVCRASGMTLADQRFEVNDYNSKYLTFIDLRRFITETNDIAHENRELITFNDAVFSLAEPSWTHIYRGKGTGSFYYGNDKGKHFNISENARTLCSTADFSNYTLIATRELAAVEPPKPTFKAGDYVERINTNYMSINIGDIAVVSRSGQSHSLSLEGHSAAFDKKNFKLAIAPKKPKFAVGDVIKSKLNEIEYTVLYIDEKSAAVGRCDDFCRFFMPTSELHNYEKVIPLRNQVISLVEHVDPSSYFEDIADAILARFNVTEKS